MSCQNYFTGSRRSEEIGGTVNIRRSKSEDSRRSTTEVKMERRTTIAGEPGSFDRDEEIFSLSTSETNASSELLVSPTPFPFPGKATALALPSNVYICLLNQYFHCSGLEPCSTVQMQPASLANYKGNNEIS